MGILHRPKQIGNPVGYGVYMNCADIGLDVCRDDQQEYLLQVPQLDKYLKFMAFRGLILNRVQSFSSPNRLDFKTFNFIKL